MFNPFHSLLVWLVDRGQQTLRLAKKVIGSNASTLFPPVSSFFSPPVLVPVRISSRHPGRGRAPMRMSPQD